MATAMEVLRAFHELTEKMGELSTTASAQLLFKSLKLAYPLLQSLPKAADGRTPSSRAYAVATILADLQMDAVLVSAGILREALLADAITINDIESQISSSTAHLLQDNLRMKDLHPKEENLDDDTATELRKQCLTQHDIKAVILELAVRLDTMRYIDHFPKFYQQQASVAALKIYAPLAHAVGATGMSLELEDLSFRHLFPASYEYLDSWLSSHEPKSKPLLETYKKELLRVLESNEEMKEMVDGMRVKSRYKSRFSTMKKLLSHQNKPEELFDILAMRVILDPKPGGDTSEERGNSACYRTLEQIQSMWKVIPARTKDYIANPKGVGYRSLHVVLDLSEHGPLVIPAMEIQIRTVAMDLMAVELHSLYKGQLNDPKEAERLKETILAAADVTASHLRDLPIANYRKGLDIDVKNPLFHFLDENGDGKISIEELTTVMRDLGAGSKDALELMQLLDANGDGFLSPEEFDSLQKQVGFMRNMEDVDDHYKSILDEKFQKTDGTGLIHAYRKELSGKLVSA